MKIVSKYLVAVAASLPLFAGAVGLPKLPGMGGKSDAAATGDLSGSRKK